jgi:hypothetical protein
MEVIRLLPTPRPTHALHLGHTAQDRVHFWEGMSIRIDVQAMRNFLTSY